MFSLNKVEIIGNLGQDPEIRYSASGDAVANLSVATTKNWKDKNGQKQSSTEWHKVVLFKSPAEIAAKYLKKGSPVYIQGSLQTRKWQDKQGIDRFTTEIVGNELGLLGFGDEPKQTKPQQVEQQDVSDDDIPF